jgi:hypothetical protein
VTELPAETGKDQPAAPGAMAGFSSFGRRLPRAQTIGRVCASCRSHGRRAFLTGARGDQSMNSKSQLAIAGRELRPAYLEGDCGASNNDYPPPCRSSGVHRVKVETPHRYFQRVLPALQTNAGRQSAWVRQSHCDLKASTRLNNSLNNSLNSTERKTNELADPNEPSAHPRDGG